MRKAAVFLLLLVIGCTPADPRPTRIVVPAGAEAAYREDHYLCKSQAAAAAPMTGSTYSQQQIWTYNDTYRECMRDFGWELR